MKILIDCSFFGGTGGIEKLVKDIIESKPDNAFIDIFVSGQNTEPDYSYKNVKFVDKQDVDKNYDYFIKIGMNFDKGLTDIINKNCIKLVNPAGFTNGIIKNFDYIWEESPNSYHNNKIKTITICPPTKIDYKNVEKNYILEQLPKEYFVTTANDYDPKIKGIDLIYEFAEKSKLPLLWFCSQNKNNISHLKLNPPKNLFIARNIRKEIILDCIKKSKAYISFSRSEGYGHSIAEAILLDKPIFTQNVGLVKYKPENFHVYNENCLEDIFKIEINNAPNYSFYKEKFNFFWKDLLSLKK